jgi:hypothetical protein
VLDYVGYTNLLPHHSYGSFPDGQSFARKTTYRATPGWSNELAVTQLPLTINEWMAGNTRTLLNPSTGRYDDWFEIHNGGVSEADLGGLYLTDALSDPARSLIPPGTRIPARGFLLVWADGLTNASPGEQPHRCGDVRLAAGRHQPGPLPGWLG